MIKDLRYFGEKLENKGVKCTIYYKHDLDQLEEENKSRPNKHIVFVNNDKVKIFYNSNTSKIEMETTEPRIKLNERLLKELLELNLIVENFNSLINI